MSFTIEPNKSNHQDIIVKVCKKHGIRSLELTTKHISLMADCIDEYIASQPPAVIGAVSQDAHEKEVMMKTFDKVRDLFEKRSWIMEGRGSYPYNDDRYKEEVRYMYDEFDALFKETWANIESKSFEYRQQIIAQYLKGNPPSGPVWVMASEFVPKNDDLIPCKIDGRYRVGNFFEDGGKYAFHVSGQTAFIIEHDAFDTFFVLHESPTAAGDGKKELAFIAAVTEEGAEMWKMEYDSCRKILQELVDLKELKDAEGKTEDYFVRQPVAWVRAKRFLEKYQHINW